MNENQDYQFIIAISTGKHKIVKINNRSKIQALKTFALSTHNEQPFMVRQQFQFVKEYLRRIEDNQSSLSVITSIELQSTEKDHESIVIRVFTQFISYPTIIEYYRNQILSMKKRRPIEKHRIKEKLIFYLEELFQLILKGGGIYNFFYSPNNIFVVATDDDDSSIETRLTLNISSTVGLKFLIGEMISKEQFIEIFPCLPPNIYQLLENQQYDKLNILIKIRSFAYHMLIYIIKRVPFLLEDNFPPMITPNDPKIKELVRGSPKTFELLLVLEKKELMAAKKETKIKVKTFLEAVLVKNSIEHWSQVLEMVFLKNYYNEPSYSRSTSPINTETETYVNRRFYFSNMIKSLWQSEPDKIFYCRLGLSMEERELDKYVYFLVKMNPNFHKVLKYENILQYFECERFSLDTNNIIYKFIDFFNQDYFTKDVQQNGLELMHAQAEHQEFSNRGRKKTLIEIDERNQYNPLYFKSQKQNEYPEMLLGPIHFLAKPLSYENNLDDTSKAGKDNRREPGKIVYLESQNGGKRTIKEQEEEYPEKEFSELQNKREKGGSAISTSRRLESLIAFEQQLWLL